MIQTRWPGRWEGDLARRLEQLTTRIEEGTQMNSLDTLREQVTAIHQPVAGEGGTQWCQVCSQEEIQPQPVGWWVPWPCPTMQAVAEAGRCSGEEGFCAEHGYHRHSPQQPEGRDLSDPPLYGAAESETRPEMNVPPLTGEELTADEAVGEPLLLCWHTEPGSPCDWDVCRQPERLAAGDPGSVPGTRHLGH